MLSTIFATTTSASGEFTIVTFLICMISALILGALIAIVHQKTSPASGSFTVTLAVIPAIVAVIIMMVNGSIGAGIAVAGSFSLVRFRSAPGTAKEIASIFLAMATGLACGMGYPLFGLLFAVILSLILIFYKQIHFGEKKSNLDRRLIIMMPEDINYTGAFDDIFDHYTKSHKLEMIKTTSLGSLNKLNYMITLKKTGIEKEFIDAIRVRNGNLEITLSELTDSASVL